MNSLILPLQVYLLVKGTKWQKDKDAQDKKWKSEEGSYKDTLMTVMNKYTCNGNINEFMLFMSV
jgi:hypothetical protein